MGKFMIITNNKLVLDNFKNESTQYLEKDLLDIMKYVRNKIHFGHRLLSHPLAGSIKPNETPYKSILISQKKEKNLNYDSLKIIEDSIQMTESLIRNKKMRKWPDRILKDFSLIDNDLIRSAIESAQVGG
ncbi:MAG TPA: GrdX family protein [Clostridia bacterium]|nr:GrdX family protein [Clostridia bacterium]